MANNSMHCKTCGPVDYSGVGGMSDRSSHMQKAHGWKFPMDPGEVMSNFYFFVNGRKVSSGGRRKTLIQSPFIENPALDGMKAAGFDPQAKKETR